MSEDSFFCFLPKPATPKKSKTDRKEIKEAKRWRKWANLKWNNATAHEKRFRNTLNTKKIFRGVSLFAKWFPKKEIVK